MSASLPSCDLIPESIVRLNRATIVVGVLAAIAFRQPPITTALFLAMLSATLFGRRGSPIYQVGIRVFRPAQDGRGEDPRLMRFNNALATILLGIAQLGFLSPLPLAGWIASAAVALAAMVALCGFCFGCYLFVQFKLGRYRLFGS